MKLNEQLSQLITSTEAQIAQKQQRIAIVMSETIANQLRNDVVQLQSDINEIKRYQQDML